MQRVRASEVHRRSRLPATAGRGRAGEARRVQSSLQIRYATLVSLFASLKVGWPPPPAHRLSRLHDSTVVRESLLRRVRCDRRAVRSRGFFSDITGCRAPRQEEGGKARTLPPLPLPLDPFSSANGGDGCDPRDAAQQQLLLNYYSPRADRIRLGSKQVASHRIASHLISSKAHLPAPSISALAEFATPQGWVCARACAESPVEVHPYHCVSPGRPRRTLTRACRARALCRRESSSRPRRSFLQSFGPGPPRP